MTGTQQSPRPNMGVVLPICNERATAQCTYPLSIGKIKTIYLGSTAKCVPNKEKFHVLS